MSVSDELLLTYKFCVFGDSGVGKTSLVDRYLTKQFHDDIRSTLGATINIKTLKIRDGKVTLQIWDFGGEEKFRFIFPAYAQGASGGICMFDLTNRDSLRNISNWLLIFRRATKDTPTILVGSKLDLLKERVVTKQDAYNLITLHRFDKYIECSSKTGENVQLIFQSIVMEILNRDGYMQVEFI
ncbi:MAG: Rab family GTPase [Candidatus Thorarchaeota archaeon]